MHVLSSSGFDVEDTVLGANASSGPQFISFQSRLCGSIWGVGSKIEIRRSDPTFAPSDIKRYVRGCEPLPRLSWPEFAVLAAEKYRRHDPARSAYLMHILSPWFASTAHGMFLVGVPPHGVIEESYSRQHGRFAAGV